jgi:hypothetical protein
MCMYAQIAGHETEVNHIEHRSWRHTYVAGTCLRACICIYVGTHSTLPMFKLKYIKAYIQIHKYTYIQAYIQIHKYTYIHTCHMIKTYIHTHTYTYKHTCHMIEMNEPKIRSSNCLAHLHESAVAIETCYVYMYVCIQAFIYPCIDAQPLLIPVMYVSTHVYKHSFIPR